MKDITITLDSGLIKIYISSVEIKSEKEKFDFSLQDLRRGGGFQCMLTRNDADKIIEALRCVKKKTG